MSVTSIEMREPGETSRLQEWLTANPLIVIKTVVFNGNFVYIFYE